jgi:hypothetical protein
MVLRSPTHRPHRDRHRIASWNTPLTLRRAHGRDRGALRRLAALDSRLLPPGPFLVAERDGTIDAAVSLSTGELLADPFRRTAETAALLRCHAGETRLAPEPDPVRARQRSAPAVRAKLVAT